MINILYQFNERYVPYAGVSIVSLLENNKHIDEINFFLIGEDISAASKELLKQQIELYGRNVEFLDSKTLMSKMKSLGINEYRGSYATNMKMFVSDFLPESIHRILYIDSDTVVAGNLQDINEIDMQGHPIAMVLDSMCGTHKQTMGFDRKDFYFNGGVMLFDMDCWRQQQCSERICDHLKNVRCHYMAPDQDVVNIVLKGNIKRLDIRYNIQPLHVDYKYEIYQRFFGQLGYYSKSEVEQALNSPVIFHFFRYLGQFPWHKDSLHPDRALFDKYLEKSLWSEYEKMPTTQNDVVFRIERWLYRILPRMLFMIIFKASYELFLWKSNRDSMKQMNNARM